MTTIQQVAEAFCGHRFAEAYPYLADDVRWVVHGGDPLQGKESVVAACESTLTGLATMTSRFTGWRSIVAERTVVVDAVGQYDAGAEGRTAVASCDILDFDEAGRVTTITSYTVEIPPEPADPDHDR